MKALVTGGAGFLGSHLCEALLARGDDVTVLDPAVPVRLCHLAAHPRLRLVRGSVLDRRRLDRLVADAEVVFHLAAVVGVERYVRDPAVVLRVNIEGTHGVLAAARRYRRKVVFASTSEVYGRNAGVPFGEDADRVLGPTTTERWCYATSKAAAEHFCFAFARRGLPVVVLRYFNVYGPRLDALGGGRVVAVFAGQCLRGEPLTVFGDGRQTRSFIYVEDAVRATVAAALAPGADGQAINVGSTEEVSIAELARRMVRLAGSSSPVVFVDPARVYGDGYADVPRRVPAVERMRALLGVRAETPLEEGLRVTLEWFKRQL